MRKSFELANDDAWGGPSRVTRQYEQFGLGVLLHRQTDKALPLWEDALRLRMPRLGAEHPHTLSSMSILGWAYINAGQNHKGLPLMEDATKIAKATLGTEHRDTLTYMSNLGQG